MNNQRLLLPLFFVLLSLAAQAQVNFNGFNYQAVVRDTNGNPVAGQAVGFRVHIHVGASLGYVETHLATTNDQGLVDLVMGEGTPEPGSVIPTFGDLVWDNGSTMLYEIQIDPAGGTAFVPLSSGIFKAVPFAMHALTSGSSSPQPVDLDADDWTISYDLDDSDPSINAGWNLSGSVLEFDTGSGTRER